MKIEDIAQELGISINEIRKRLEVGGYNNSGDVITNEEYKYLKVNSKNQAQNIKENVSEFFIEKKYTQDNFTFETISVNDDFWSQELVFHSTEKPKKESSEDIPENKITQQEDLNKLNTENPSGNITAATIKQGINKTEKIEQAENENRIKVEIKKNITEVKKECVSNNKTGGRAQHNSIASNTYKAKCSTTDKNFSKDGLPLKEGSGILNTKNKLKADRISNKESYDDDDKKDNGGDKKTPFVGYFHKINTENIKKFKLLKKEKLKNKNANKTIEDTKKIVVTNKVSLKDLAVMLNCEVEDLASLCHDLDIPITTQYQTLERNVILLLAGEYDYEVSFPEIDKKNDDDIQQDSRSRKPIITVVGHVDHGKTTLVDYICKSSVAKLEQGGITQNINAYNITTEGGDEFTLIDTPGHKIFTEMRARAINIADIAIVIIAADSGIQEQTKEILQQITFFGKPTVFAFNKIDKEGANVNKIKELLATLNFVTEDWGGQYQCQEISALKGTGIEKLLEKVMLEATILNLKVDYNCPANGIVLDSFFDKTIGYQNKILVKEGTLKEHDFIVAGILYGKIRQIKKGNAITKEVFPSESAIITGISGCAQPGESFSIVKNEREGRERADKYQQILREQHAKAQQKITFDMLKKRMHEGDKKKVGIIVNACSRDIGRVILEVLSNFSSDKYSIDILKENIGEILNSDIDAAINSKAMIIGFNVKISPTTMKYAEKNNTIVKIYNVIYDLSEHIDELLESYDGKNKELKNVGKAEVLQIFKIKKAGTIAGCVIREGAAHIKDIVNVNRNGKIIFTGNIKSMRHGPVDISEAKLDTECGVCINRYDDVKKGDILEFMQRQ